MGERCLIAPRWICWCWSKHHRCTYRAEMRWWYSWNYSDVVYIRWRRNSLHDPEHKSSLLGDRVVQHQHLKIPSVEIWSCCAARARDPIPRMREGLRCAIFFFFFVPSYCFQHTSNIKGSARCTCEGHQKWLRASVERQVKMSCPRALICIPPIFSHCRQQNCFDAGKNILYITRWLLQGEIKLKKNSFDKNYLRWKSL